MPRKGGKLCKRNSETKINMKTKYYTRLGTCFFESWINGIFYLMGVTNNKWAAYFSDGTVNPHIELNYYDFIDSGDWVEVEYPKNWVQPKKVKLDIAAEIKKCLLNEGYGKTAAELHVNEITESVFKWAYELGKKSKEIS